MKSSAACHERHVAAGAIQQHLMQSFKHCCSARIAQRSLLQPCCVCHSCCAILSLSYAQRSAALVPARIASIVSCCSCCLFQSADDACASSQYQHQTQQTQQLAG